MSQAKYCAFGDFVIDQSQRQLRHRDGMPLKLPPRMFSALMLFIERPGQLFERDKLVKALWPDLVVVENNLNQVILFLRKVLGDQARHSRYIQTVKYQGFRFVAAVTDLRVD